MMIGLSLGLCSTTGQGGVDYIAQILGAGGLDYAEFDFGRLSLLFQDTAGTTPVTTIGQTIGRANVKAKAPHSAQQATSSFRPQYQAAGAKFDGSDDNLLTDWLAQAGANCLFVRATVPATVSATQVMLGAQDAGATNRFWLGVTTGGLPYCGLGASATQIAGYDIRGREVVFGVTCNGSTIRVYLDGALILSQSQNGAPTTTVPLRLGASAIAATVINYFAGGIRKAVAGYKYLSDAEALQISTQLMAA